MKNNIEKARNFAYNKHNVPQECKRYGNALYTEHLENVVNVAKKYLYYLPEECHEDIIIACLCHDCIEDTPANPRDIRRSFNDRIADIVFAVTNERGEDRKEMNFKTYPKIWKNDLAIFVKLCDRISNTKNSKETGHKMYETYHTEYPVFRYAIKVRELYPDMWKELDELNGWSE